jgi:hypothetical protein
MVTTMLELGSGNWKIMLLLWQHVKFRTGMLLCCISYMEPDCPHFGVMLDRPSG